MQAPKSSKGLKKVFLGLPAQSVKRVSNKTLNTQISTHIFDSLSLDGGNSALVIGF